VAVGVEQRTYAMREVRLCHLNIVPSRHAAIMSTSALQRGFRSPAGLGSVHRPRSVKVHDPTVDVCNVGIRRGYRIALALAVALFAFVGVVGAVVRSINNHEVQHNASAARQLAAIRWPAQLKQSPGDGCAAICLRDSEPVAVGLAVQTAAHALGITNATAKIGPGYDGAPEATIAATFDGVPVTLTAYARVEYPPTLDGTPTEVTYVEVALSPSTILNPAE